MSASSIQERIFRYRNDPVTFATTNSLIDMISAYFRRERIWEVAREYLTCDVVRVMRSKHSYPNFLILDPEHYEEQGEDFILRISDARFPKSSVFIIARDEDIQRNAVEEIVWLLGKLKELQQWLGQD